MKPINLQLNVEAAEVREETVGGITYTIVPTVAAMATVMNGIYYPDQVWEWSLPSWNGRPVTIDHPTDGAGIQIMANSPDVLDAVGLGQLFNATYEDHRLKGEMWLNPSCNAITNNRQGTAVLNSLKAGNVREVSTGLWLETVPETGIRDGQEYTERVVNLWPDHLAVLTQGIGACSISDGCGAPRSNKRAKNMRRMTNYYQSCSQATNVETSFRDTFALLNNEVAGEGEFIWIADIWAEGNAGYFVYEVTAFNGETTLYRRDYELSDDGTAVNTIGERQEVMKRTTYVDVRNQGANPVSKLFTHFLNLLKGAKPMSALDELAAMGFDRDALALLPEAQLNLMHERLHQNEDAPTAEVVSPVNPTPVTIPAELTELAELIKQAGGAKTFLDGLGAAGQIAATNRQNREQRIKALVNSGRCPLSETAVALLPDDEIAKLEAAARVVNYSGMGFSPNLQPQIGEDDEPVGAWNGAAAGVKVKIGGAN